MHNKALLAILQLGGSMPNSAKIISFYKMKTMLRRPVFSISSNDERSRYLWTIRDDGKPMMVGYLKQGIESIRETITLDDELMQVHFGKKDVFSDNEPVVFIGWFKDETLSPLLQT